DWRNCQFSGSTKWRVCRTSRNNGEKEKEKMRRNLTSCFSLFSHP
ncbi:hypothetical protein ALC53_03751, partial [Atta colombica]